MFLSGKSDLSKNVLLIGKSHIIIPLHHQRAALIFLLAFFQIFRTMFLNSKQKTVALLTWGSRRVVAIYVFSYRLFFDAIS